MTDTHDFADAVRREHDSYLDSTWRDLCRTVLDARTTDTILRDDRDWGVPGEQLQQWETDLAKLNDLRVDLLNQVERHTGIHRDHLHREANDAVERYNRDPGAPDDPDRFAPPDWDQLLRDDQRALGEIARDTDARMQLTPATRDTDRVEPQSTTVSLDPADLVTFDPSAPGGTRPVTEQEAQVILERATPTVPDQDPSPYTPGHEVADGVSTPNTTNTEADIDPLAPGDSTWTPAARQFDAEFAADQKAVREHGEWTFYDPGVGAPRVISGPDDGVTIDRGYPTDHDAQIIRDAADREAAGGHFELADSSDRLAAAVHARNSEGDRALADLNAARDIRDREHLDAWTAKVHAMPEQDPADVYLADQAALRGDDDRKAAEFDDVDTSRRLAQQLAEQEPADPPSGSTQPPHIDQRQMEPEP